MSSLIERCYYMLEAFRGWRTYAFNALALLVLVAHEYGFVLEDNDDQVKSLAPWVVLIVNIILRTMTKTPAFKRSID